MKGDFAEVCLYTGISMAGITFNRCNTVTIYYPINCGELSLQRVRGFFVDILQQESSCCFLFCILRLSLQTI